jgi:hypothetical protein
LRLSFLAAACFATQVAGQGIDYAKIQIRRSAKSTRSQFAFSHVHPDHTAGDASFDPAKLRVDGEIVDLIPIRAAHTSADRFIGMVYSQLKSGQ